MGGLESSAALHPDGQDGLKPHDHSRIEPLTQELQDAKSVTVKQVGPAPGQPTTIVTLEAAVIDWLPSTRIPSWPGVLGDPSNEAGDTLALRPVSPRPYADRKAAK